MVEGGTGTAAFLWSITSLTSDPSRKQICEDVDNSLDILLCEGPPCGDPGEGCDVMKLPVGQ